MKQYLGSCDYIDWQTSAVLAQANKLASQTSSELDIARNCFKFVRDEIEHSWDYQRDEPACAASEVLNHMTGWCYAKSHLLAALLRANQIPTGLCYQRLTIEGNAGPYCLHGLNALYLKGYGWYRVDARGNNENVQAGLCPPKEKLAYPVKHPGEADLSGIWPQPLPVITNLLEKHHGCREIRANLPDIELY